MPIKLQPCPECGGKAKLKRGLPNVGNSKTRFALVQCLNCNSKTLTFKPKKGESCTDEKLKDLAIKAWNEGKIIKAKNS